MQPMICTIWVSSNKEGTVRTKYGTKDELKEMIDELHKYHISFYGDYCSINGERSPHTKILDILLGARRKYAYGDQIEYFDHPSTIGFIRTGDEEHPGFGLVFLMSNDEAGSKMMSLGKEHKAEVWHEITGSIQEEVTLDAEGNLPLNH